MKFILHHACKKDGGKEFVERSAPFPSIYDPEKKYKPYLGTGFYFWDYNIDYAKFWGNRHYNGNYYVLKCEVIISDENKTYLDLVGNRIHLEGFVSLLQEFDLIDEKGIRGIDLCYIIDYLRKNCSEDSFPFNIIRAVDYKNDEQKGIKINFSKNGNNQSFTMLNPRIIFSFKNKDEIPYKSKPFIIFAS